MVMNTGTDEIVRLLHGAGLRATRPRVALCSLIFRGEHRHVTADGLFREAREAGIKVAFATVYNVLNQLVQVGLLREILVDPRRTFFDTNTAPHHHFFYEDEGILEDIPVDGVNVTGLPRPPSGATVRSVDVIVRVAAAP